MANDTTTLLLRGALVDVIKAVHVPEKQGNKQGLSFCLSWDERGSEKSNWSSFRSLLGLTKPEYLYLLVKAELVRNKSYRDTEQTLQEFNVFQAFLTSEEFSEGTEHVSGSGWIKLRVHSRPAVPCICFGIDPKSKSSKWIKREDHTTIVESVALETAILKDAICREMQPTVAVSPQLPSQARSTDRLLVTSGLSIEAQSCNHHSPSAEYATLVSTVDQETQTEWPYYFGPKVVTIGQDDQRTEVIIPKNCVLLTSREYGSMKKKANELDVMQTRVKKVLQRKHYFAEMPIHRRLLGGVMASFPSLTPVGVEVCSGLLCIVLTISYLILSCIFS
jgi:hypothetical protein